MFDSEFFNAYSSSVELYLQEMLTDPINLKCTIFGHDIDKKKHLEIFNHIDWQKLSDGFLYKESHDTCYRCDCKLNIYMYPKYPKKLFAQKDY